MPFPTALHFFGLKMAVMHSLYIFVVLVPCTWLLQSALRKFGTMLVMPWRELLITAGYFAIALNASLASFVALQDSGNPSFYAVTTFLIYPLFAWAITIGVALQSQVVSQELTLRKLRDDLAWAVARVNLLDWFNQGLISRLLHGPIQNSLQAASIRLQESPGAQNTDKVIQELSQRMNEIAPLIQAENFIAPDISKTLGDLIELWADLAKIEVFFEQAVQIRLEQDVPAAYIALDICQEICSNAIRHAKAKMIEIRITASGNAITIAMIDDGEPRKQNSEFGIGTEFLTTCSIDWRYVRNANSQNLLKIVIPSE
jgi:signal transduction histidine kinase